MRRMKYKIGAFCLLAIGLWGCLEDKGVYDYDFDVAPEIKIDTVGTDKTELFRTWEIGDTILLRPGLPIVSLKIWYTVGLLWIPITNRKRWGIRRCIRRPTPFPVHSI